MVAGRRGVSKRGETLGWLEPATDAFWRVRCVPAGGGGSGAGGNARGQHERAAVGRGRGGGVVGLRVGADDTKPRARICGDAELGLAVVVSRDERRAGGQVVEGHGDGHRGAIRRGGALEVRGALPGLRDAVLQRERRGCEAPTDELLVAGLCRVGDRAAAGEMLATRDGRREFVCVLCACVWYMRGCCRPGLSGRQRPWRFRSRHTAA